MMETVNLTRCENEKPGSHTLDTMDLARQEREKPGTWEVEVSYGGEGDLHRHLTACDKNPGHLNFIPVDKFNMEHLPSGCHDNDIVDLVRTMSDLTVRVSVKYVSENRPETVPGSDKPYPCYSDRRREMMRVGTGWICDVLKFPNENMKDETCECKECMNSHTPETTFGRIDIQTVAHVVYDKLEGAESTCHLFFDRAGTPGGCSGVVTLSGTSGVRKTIIDRDFCELIYNTHDMDLVDRLDKMMVSWRFLGQKIYKKYDIERLTESDTQSARLAVDPFKIPTIILSHPHGCSKQVSVGYCTNFERGIDQSDIVTYTTATCPGSSGAPVFLVGLKNWYGYLVNHHIGNCTWKKELNFGGQTL